MKRRKFIENVFGTTVVFGLTSPMAFGGTFREKEKKRFSPGELIKSFKCYFDPIFLMQNVDLNCLPSKGLVILADSYELKENKERTDIFDVAEAVIEETKPYGFNAKPLLEGKMPEGLTVYSESISFTTNGLYKSVKIPNLRNYDIEVSYKRPVTINYRVPFSEVIKENSFLHLGSDDKYNKYQGENTHARLFINMHDISRNFNVDSISPFNIRSADNLNQPAFSKEAFSRYITDNFTKLIFS